MTQLPPSPGPAEPAPPPPAPLRRPRRLSPLTPLARSFVLLVAAGLSLAREVGNGGGDLGVLGLALLAALAGGLVLGAVSWARTTFWVEADELRIDTGLLSRQSRRIRIDRLQGADIVQPFAARLMGLAELRLDVAGGNREGSLAYLSLRDAREYRDLLLARRDQVRGAGAPEPAVDRVPGPADRELARVDLPLLVKSTLLSSETVVLVLSGLGFLAALLLSGRWLEGGAALLSVMGGTAFLMVRRFTGGYGCTVTETAAGLQVRRGLFDLNVQTIALPRVQGLVVTEPWLWRLLGWARLDVSVAGYGSDADEGPAPSTVLTVGEVATVRALARHVLLDQSRPEGVPLVPPPRRTRWLDPVGHRVDAAGADDRVAVARDGWLVRRTHVVPHARVQSVRLTQGPLQRWLGLADLHLDSPPGPTRLRMRHRDAQEARHWFDAEVGLSRRARRSARGTGPAPRSG